MGTTNTRLQSPPPELGLDETTYTRLQSPPLVLGLEGTTYRRLQSSPLVLGQEGTRYTRLQSLHQCWDWKRQRTRGFNTAHQQIRLLQLQYSVEICHIDLINPREKVMYLEFDNNIAYLNVIYYVISSNVCKLTVELQLIILFV